MAKKRLLRALVMDALNIMRTMHQTQIEFTIPAERDDELPGLSKFARTLLGGSEEDGG